jgi:hypothetical protein
MSNQLDLKLHARQTDAFLTEATELLYGGAAGGGKSHLLRVASIVWCTEIPGLQVYLFRRVSDDLIKNHLAGSGSYMELLAPWIENGLVKYNASKNTLTFWNRACIWLCHCQYEKDMYKYQGAEIHVLLIDELTHFTEQIYRFLRGRCRLGGLQLPRKYAGMFPRIVAGSNPGGIGHNFVRRMFVNAAPPMHCVRQDRREGGLIRQYIPARLDDNPTLRINDPDYVYRLEGLGNEALVKAMKEGDWNIVAGGALDDVWDDNVLRVPRFVVPSTWRLDRSLDWGSAKPFSIGWWAEADGTEATLPDGRKFCPARGSLVRIFEWYGTKELGTNEGLRLGSRVVAQGIRERERMLLEGGWIKASVNPGPADNSIEAVEDEDSDSIAKLMRMEGVRWNESDKSPGSRLVGLQLIRDRLLAAKKREGKAIYFMDVCTASFATLPVLPRDLKKPEDVDTDAEDHLYDDVRYRVLADARRYASKLTVKHPT